MTAWTSLQVATTDRGVHTITLDRPARLNAVNPALADELPAAFAMAHADDAVRVVVVTGAGRGFCAGLDLTEPAGFSPRSRAERLDDLGWVGRWVLAVRSCEKPVIAAVNGPAAGAGLGLALACDIRLLSERAVLSAGYIRRALSPDAGVTWFLPRLVGVGRAAELLLSGRDISAGEAERIGLATQLLAEEGFSQAVSAYAEVLAAGPPLAYALTKRLLNESATQTLATQLRLELGSIKECLGTPESQAAIVAFRSRRGGDGG
jgi:2-(1,2-epoxy-1,2-dihydrophenyl)acetyl-CoA isomerase